MNFEFLRDIAAAVDGIPDKHFNLDVYQNGAFFRSGSDGLPPHPHTCHTLGCVAGWMCLHPTLALPGTKWAPRQWRVNASEVISGERRFVGPAFQRAYDLFDIAEFDTPSLETEKTSHKVIFARRVIKYLDDHGQPVNNDYRLKYERLWWEYDLPGHLYP